MSVTNYVIMPSADYHDICNAVREKSGKLSPLKSGEIAPAVRSIVGASAIALGNKLYSFGILSDVHTFYGNGVEKLKAAIPILQNYGAAFIVCSGDLVNSANVTELQTHADAVSAVATIPFYSCNGNHDIGFTDGDWEAYVGHPLNHVLEYDGDVFIFFSLNTTTGYGAEKIKWLKERLDEYFGRRIFLISHFPLSGYSGLRPGTYYGFTSSSTEDDTILNMMIDTKNVVHISGHTHFLFEAEETYPDITLIGLSFADCATVHVPSTNYPRKADNTAVYSGKSQGYIATAYENGIVLKAVDFIAGEYMDEYEYVLPIRNSKTSGSIVVSASSVDVVEGGTVSFTIKLARQPETVVVVELSSDANNIISLDKDSLTFTPENYNIEQSVTITANEDDDKRDANAAITVSCTGFTNRIVSVTVTDNDVGELPYTWSQGYIDNNGRDAENSTVYYKTSMIDVSGMEEVIVYSTTLGKYCFLYDANQAFIKRVTLTTGENVISDDCAFIRLRTTPSPSVPLEAIGDYIYLV